MRTVHGGVGLALVLLLGGCAASATGGADPASPRPASAALPPAGGFDYQLGGAYAPPQGTTVVVRDRTASPAPGVYSICYLNGFQSQPGEAEAWQGLLLQGPDGPVADPGWPDEYLLDTSTAEKRVKIAARVVEWITGCAAAGYQAVEFDNLDSYLRSGNRLTSQDNLALAGLLVDAAHAAGLSAGQKNAQEVSRQAAAAGFDFAVTEECGAYDECGKYLAVYQSVLDVEYADADGYAQMCRSGSLPAQSVRRDLELTTPSSPDYVFARCPAP